MSYRIASAAFLASALLLASCGKSADDAGSNNSTTAIDSAQLAPEVQSPTPAPDQPPAQSVVTHIAVMSTDSGDIEIELYGKEAPKTVENFVGLAKKKFYNGIGFHRVVPGFVIQAGDPLSKDTTKRAMWGSSGESIYGNAFEDELNPATPSYQRGYVEGTVAMANAGPNTNRSQFFIVFGGQVASGLPKNYTIFGFVRKGMDVAHKIESVWRGADMIENPVRIKGVKVTEAPVTASAGDTAAKPH